MSIECMHCGEIWKGIDDRGVGGGDEAIAAGWVQHHHLPGMPWECDPCQRLAEMDSEVDERQADEAMEHRGKDGNIDHGDTVTP